MKIVTVIPLVTKTTLDDLTYFTAKDIEPGYIVSILIRNKKTLGLVIDSTDVADTKEGIKKMPFNLKKIEELKGKSIFREEFIASALDMGKYFVAKKGITISSMLPAIFREKYDLISKINFSESKSETTKEIRTEKLLLQASFDDRISFYKTLIRESFASKKSIFIVLPNEQDVSLFSSLLSKGIENFVFSFHGELSSKKVINAFTKIANSSHPVLILGTAPYLSIPRPDIGTIVLEHESSTTYKMMSRPYFDLRTFVEVYAIKTKTKLIFGDSILSFETIGRKEIDGFAEITPMSFRLNFKGDIEIFEKEKKFQILMDNTVAEIKNNILVKKNTFIFSLRKGLATMTVCRDCSESLFCKNCKAPIVLYLSSDGKKKIFICNKCKDESPTDTICPRCGSWNLFPLGVGTDTVYEEVIKIFAKNKNLKILKLDKDSAKTKKGAEKIIKEFEESKGSILVGTEMAYFYMKEQVDLSVVASFDSLWSVPNYKMNERIVQIINSLLAKTIRKLIIQTKNPNDLALQAIKNENLLPFIREELEDREELGYPPYKRFIKIKYLGDKKETEKARQGLKEVFKEYNPDIFSGFIPKQKDKYLTNVLIKLDTQKWSLPELSMRSGITQDLSDKLSSLPPNFEVFVDPEDLL